MLEHIEMGRGQTEALLDRDATTSGDNSVSGITPGGVPKDGWIDVTVVDLNGNILRYALRLRAEDFFGGWGAGSTRASCMQIHHRIRRPGTASWLLCRFHDFQALATVACLKYSPDVHVMDMCHPKLTLLHAWFDALPIYYERTWHRSIGGLKRGWLLVTVCE